ncbi:MAG: zinc carboxypeptidase, partial [Calditrichia bacterium]|nr:zinc carboxypeptidase [Calditrichia bacterium]
MKKFLLMLIAALMFFSFAQSKEHYFRFNERNKTEVNKITRMISIDNVKDGWVYAYANDKQLKNFQSLGYAIEHLPHPGSLISPKMSDNFMKVKEWDSYPTFEAYVSMMQQFAIDFPDLCVLDTIGFSVENRPLLVVKISDNVNIEETEAEFFYTSTMHGDETTGYILMLRLIDFLLTNYGESTDDGVRATNLVNNLEIWINPLANPDGTYASGNSTVNGATRYNANYVDLNRNYPDPEDGQHPDGEVW